MYQTTIKSSFEPHKYQRKLLNCGSYKRILGIAGRQAGKSRIVAEYISRQLGDGKDILYIAPTVEQTESVMPVVAGIFKDYIDEGEASYSESRNELIVPELGRIKARTGKEPHYLRGGHWDIVVLDEAFMLREEIYTRVVPPMLLRTNGQLIIISTPPTPDERVPGVDSKWLLDLWHNTLDNPQWLNLHWRTRDNPSLIERAV